MPSVEELLSVAEADADTRSTMDSRIEIDADTRIIRMMPQDELFGVESDEKSERKYFKVPKIVGNGVDLSKLQLRINYQNASKIPSGKDMYIVQDATVYNDEWVYFSWELSRKVTQYKGNIYFIVCAVKADSMGNITNEWNTTLAEGKVLEGLEIETSQEQQYQASDYLEQLKQQLLDYSKEIKDTFPSDYTQIQDDIGSLKEDLGDESTKIIDLMMDYVYQYLGNSTIAVKNVVKKGTFDVTTGQVIEHDTRYYTPFYIPNYIKLLSRTSATLYVWDGNDTYKLFDGASLKPMGWLYNSGVDFVIDANGVEHCIFAEYDGSTLNKNGFYVWKGTYPYTSESDWKTVFHKDISWEPVVPNTIVHFHQIRRDPWTNILYLTSGDKEGQLNWWYSIDYGDTWTLLISDTSDNYSWEAHILRCINFVFTKDYIYWAVDHGTNSCLNRIKRNSSGIIDLSTREKLCDLPFAIATNSICYVESPNGIFLYTRVDTGLEYESHYGTKVPVLFWSFKTEKLYNLMELGLTNNSWGGHRGKCYLNYTSGQQPYPAMGFSDDTRCYFDIAGADNSNIGTIFYDI